MLIVRDRLTLFAGPSVQLTSPISGSEIRIAFVIWGLGDQAFKANLPAEMIPVNNASSPRIVDKL